jgi:N-acetylglutamate synthase-like GNAT family acetyltransferase
MLPVRRAGGRASLTRRPRTYAEAGSRGAFSTGPGVELLIIRDAVVDDETALRDLFRRSSLSNERDREALLAHPEALEYTAFAFTQRRIRVAVEDDDVVGFAAFSLASRVTELNDLFVDPDFMGRGIGRALVADVVATSRSLGAAQVEVTANEDAAGFYEKAGFTFEGEVATRFGAAPRMRRDLDPRVSPTRTTLR